MEIFGKNVNSILATNGYIIMCIGWDIYAAAVEGGHSTLDKFTKIYGTNAEEMEIVNDNKILFLTKGSSSYTEQEKEKIVAEINRVFNRFDWKTYCRDGEWHWLTQGGVTYPLIFQ